MPTLYNTTEFQTPTFSSEILIKMEQTRQLFASRRDNGVIDLHKCIDAQDKNLLHWAIEARDAQLTLDLLAAGADPNVRDDNGNTPLHRLFWMRDTKELIEKRILKALLKKMDIVHLNQPNEEGKTVLHELMFSLLNLSISGFTLYADCSSGKISDWYQDFALLKAAGVSFIHSDAKDLRDTYLYDFLKTLPYKDFIKDSDFEIATHIIRALLQQGVSTAENTQGLTPLDIAEAMDYPPLIEVLGGKRGDTEEDRQIRRYELLDKIKTPTHLSSEFTQLFQVYRKEIFEQEKTVHTLHDEHWSLTLEGFRIITCLQFQVYQDPSRALHYLETIRTLVVADTPFPKPSKELNIFQDRDQKCQYTTKDSTGNNILHTALLQLFYVLQDEIEAIKNHDFTIFRLYFLYAPHFNEALYQQSNKLGLTPKNLWKQFIRPSLSQAVTWDHYKFIIDRALSYQHEQEQAFLGVPNNPTMPLSQPALVEYKSSLLGTIPLELLMQILSLLPPRGITAFNSISKKSKSILENNSMLSDFKHHLHPFYQQHVSRFGFQNWKQCMSLFNENPHMLKGTYWFLWFQNAYRELERCIDLSNSLPSDTMNPNFARITRPPRSIDFPSNSHVHISRLVRRTYSLNFHTPTLTWSWLTKLPKKLSPQFMLQLLLAHPYYFSRNILENTFGLEHKFSLKADAYEAYLKDTFLQSNDSMKLFLLNHEAFRDSFFKSLIGCIETQSAVLKELVMSSSEEILLLILHSLQIKEFVRNCKISDSSCIGFLKDCFECSLNRLLGFHDTEKNYFKPGEVAYYLLQDTEYQTRWPLISSKLDTTYVKIQESLDQYDLHATQREFLNKISKAWDKLVDTQHSQVTLSASK